MSSAGHYSQIGTQDVSALQTNAQSHRSQELTSISKHNHGHSHSHGHGGSCNHDHGSTASTAHSHTDGHGHSHSNPAPPRIQSNRPAKKEDDACGHNHGSGEGCHSKNSKTSDIMIRFFTMFMPFNCIMLQQFWLNDSLANNQFEYYANTIFMWVILFFCNVTYYQAVTIKNNVIQRMPPPADPSIFDPVMRNNQMCKDCNYWKPMRTKHCRTCGGCNLRMDHHCPWLTNCVGLRNNRAFYLFTIYMMVGALQYCYRTLMYFNYLGEVDDFWENSGFFYAYWLFTTVILVPISLMLIGLSCFHSMLLINNATTLDAMGGLSLGLPFQPQGKRKPNQRSTNVFNRGIVANVRDFFSGDLLFWWWPFETTNPNDGLLYPMAPAVTFMDVQNEMRKSQEHIDGIKVYSQLNEYNRRIQEEHERLSQCNLQAGTAIVELWRESQTTISQETSSSDSTAASSTPAQEISLL